MQYGAEVFLICYMAMLSVLTWLSASILNRLSTGGVTININNAKTVEVDEDEDWDPEEEDGEGEEEQDIIPDTPIVETNEDEEEEEEIVKQD